jgi:hypothetical protein
MENPTKINPDTETVGVAKEGKAESLFDHLKSPELAIQTCIGSVDTYQDSLPEYFGDLPFTKDFSDDPAIDNIDFTSSDAVKETRGQLSQGESTFVISGINSLNKLSLDFYDCTGLIAVGKDKKTGENKSFACHCPPYSKPSLEKEEYKKLQSDLLDRLIQLRLMSEEGTVDVVVLGGLTIGDSNYACGSDEYKFMMDLYKSCVTTSLGFNPISVGGPKLDLIVGGSDHVYFDNKTRRLYLLRPWFSEKVSALPKKL